jgi:hypothetical protein
MFGSEVDPDGIFTENVPIAAAVEFVKLLTSFTDPATSVTVYVPFAADVKVLPEEGTIE